MFSPDGIYFHYRRKYKMDQWPGKAGHFFSYADKCFVIDKATMEITPELSAQMDRDLVHTDSFTFFFPLVSLCYQGK